MAHIFDTSARKPGSGTTASAINDTYTCGVGATVLVVMLAYTDSTPRTGGAPTYNGVALTQAATTTGATEGCCELWYLLTPPTNYAYALVVPNDNARTMVAMVASAKAQAGYTSVLDDADVHTGTSNTQNVTEVTTVAGDIIFAAVFVDTDSYSVTTRTGTSLAEEDVGAWGWAAQYYVVGAPQSQTINWFATSTAYGAVGAAFKEVQATFYVDATGGDDEDTGLSIDHAWQTIAKVNASSFNPGYSILFKRGETWQATPAAPNGASIRCSSSGAEGNPIYFGVYGTGADPIFDQCVIYTDWAVHSGACYKRTEASDGDYGRQVFEGGVRLVKVADVATCISTAGSWVGTGGVQYVHCADGGDPNGEDVGYPADNGYPNAFDPYGHSWITVENLHFTRPKNHCVGLNSVDGCVGIVAIGCTGSWAGGRGFRFFPATADGAHQITDCRISYCVAHDTIAEGIWVGGGETIIEYCEVYDCKKDYTRTGIGASVDMAGIIVGVWADGCIMRHNHIHDAYHGGLFMLEYEAGYGGESARPTGCIIEYNHFDNNVAGAGSNVTLQGDATCSFVNNIVENQTAATAGNLIRVDNTSGDMLVAYNTFVQRKAGTNWIAYGQANSAATFRNNIFRGIGGNLSCYWATDFTATIDHNQYGSGADGTTFYGQVGGTTYNTANFSNYLAAISETNSALGSPVFVDEDDDYNLQVTSPCIGAGVAVDGITDDYNGMTRNNPPDIGAYEYASVIVIVITVTVTVVAME